MAINPYRDDGSLARVYATQHTVEQLQALLDKAERLVEKRSAVARAAPGGTSRAGAKARARLTTACEMRDVYQAALRLAKEAA